MSDNPYQSPGVAVSDGARAREAVAVAGVYRSPLALGKWTAYLLAADMLLSVVSIISGMMQIDLLSRDFTQAEGEANDARQQVVGVLQLLNMIAIASVFLTWFHRAHKNLGPLGGRDFKWSPGWAVGGFFIPFMNLVRPFQVMCETWHGSNPVRLASDRAKDGPAQRDARPVPPLVVAWWALFILMGVCGQIANHVSFSAQPSLEDLKMMSAVLVLQDVLSIADSVLAILVVLKISWFQDERSWLMQRPPPVAEAA
jgi:hypothetical protein